MRQYEKPEFHYVPNTGGLSSKEIAELSDEELAEYLKKCNFQEEKKCYRVKPDFVMREIAGEYAIVPVGEECLISNAVMTPNDTAVFFWKAFQKPSTIEDVVKKGINEYEISEDKIRSAAHRFITETLRYQVCEEVK